ncbi:MAG: hypothetical protein OIF35_08225 [Cellvibrionaceae bacterium]|nr:hypothetical protein [Cellvibrionaceae bacterium]
MASSRQSRCLVTRLGPEPSAQVSASDDLGLQAIRSLGFGRGPCASMLFANCMRRQALSQKDLRSNTQRVLYQLQQGDAEACYGGLLDLFIALGEHGQPLRQRLLNQCQGLLKAEYYRALSACLDGQLSAEQLPFSAKALYAQYRHGKRALVTRHQQHPGDHSLALYRGFMDAGEIQQAREVLETAVYDGYPDIELHRELIELLEQMGDHSSLKNIAQALLEKEAMPEALVYLWRQQLNLLMLDSNQEIGRANDSP